MQVKLVSVSHRNVAQSCETISFKPTLLLKMRSGNVPSAASLNGVPHFSVHGSTYGSNLLCISKQSSLKGKPTDEAQTPQMSKNRNNGEFGCGHSCRAVTTVSQKCEFCVLMTQRWRRWGGGGDTGEEWAAWSNRCSSCVPLDPCHPLGSFRPVVATIHRWKMKLSCPFLHRLKGRDLVRSA